MLRCTPRSAVRRKRTLQSHASGPYLLNYLVFNGDQLPQTSQEELLFRRMAVFQRNRPDVFRVMYPDWRKYLMVTQRNSQFSNAPTPDNGKNSGSSVAFWLIGSRLLVGLGTFFEHSIAVYIYAYHAFFIVILWRPFFGDRE